MSIVHGTEGADVIKNNNDEDVIYGYGGNDILYGYIFDDDFSQTNDPTYQEYVAAAENYWGILVAQRPSMIMLMDQILVLQNGKATQFGPRAEVLRTVLRKDQGAV